jgi:hypothetical protein
VTGALGPSRAGTRTSRARTSKGGISSGDSWTPVHVEVREEAVERSHSALTVARFHGNAMLPRPPVYLPSCDEKCRETTGCAETQNQGSEGR